MQTMATNLHGRIGKMIILPSTFIGSPRNILQNYQDSQWQLLVNLVNQIFSLQ